MTSDESAFLDMQVASCGIDGLGLEIGTAAGGSLCRMVHAGQGRRRFITVDPMTYFANQVAIVRRNMELKAVSTELVELRFETSLRARLSSRKAGERFAFMLIDGKHDSLQVMQDLLWTHQLLVGGTICLHDYCSSRPGVYVPVAMFLQRNREAFEVIGRVGTLLALRKTNRRQSYWSFFPQDWFLAFARHISMMARNELHHRWRRASKLLAKVARVFAIGGSSSQASYEQQVIKSISKGKPHKTLGPAPISDGLLDFGALLAFGLKPHHRVLDFGCGTLRLGRHLIDYLSLGQYWGLDPSEKLIQMGLDHWYGNRVLPLNAYLGVISHRALSMAADARPDLILLLGVLQSVPPEFLGRTFSQIERACVAESVVIVTLLEAQAYTRLGRHAHRHGLAEVECAADVAGLDVEVLQRGFEAETLMKGVQNRQDGAPRATILVIRRKRAHFSITNWNREAALAYLRVPKVYRALVPTQIEPGA